MELFDDGENGFNGNGFSVFEFDIEEDVDRGHCKLVNFVFNSD